MRRSSHQPGSALVPLLPSRFERFQPIVSSLGLRTRVLNGARLHETIACSDTPELFGWFCFRPLATQRFNPGPSFAQVLHARPPAALDMFDIKNLSAIFLRCAVSRLILRE